MGGNSVADAGPIDWPNFWLSTADRLAFHWQVGRGHLLTEDSLRFSLVEALHDAGVGADRLAVEVLAPVMPKAKLDLTVDGVHGTIVELKYPRDSRTGISPDTMTLGEILRDFCRVGLVDAQDRWVAQVINTRLANYLARAARKYDLDWAIESGDRMVLSRKALSGLPRTALMSIGETPWRLPMKQHVEPAHR